MSDTPRPGPPPRPGPRLPLKGINRTPIDLAAPLAVDSKTLTDDASFPLLVTPRLSGVDLVEWARSNASWCQSKLAAHGALLMRDFRVDGLDGFERFMRIVAPSLFAYTERSTPRTRVGQDVYTSTEYPAYLDIVQHNESSYASTWPRTIAFYCHVPAARGGETPLADSAEVYRRLTASTIEAFTRHGVMYVRNYGHGVDLSWTDAYQTTDRAAVEAYCRAASIDVEWLDDGRRLRTRQVRPAVARHPETRDWLWFNQAHLFHTSSLDEATRDALHAAYAESDLPRHAFFGDGSSIPVHLLDEIREAYRASSHIFPWQRGDVLLLDNMRITHGRRAFSGPRTVYAALADPWDRIE